MTHYSVTLKNANAKELADKIEKILIEEVPPQEKISFERKVGDADVFLYVYERRYPLRQKGIVTFNVLITDYKKETTVDVSVSGLQGVWKNKTGEQFIEFVKRGIRDYEIKL